MAGADASEAFDYVIVGGGTAGAVLADRLSADGRTSVCVLEAGGRDTNPYIHVPAGFMRLLADRRATWQFQTEPGPFIEGRSVALPQGRVLGGSSSINGLAYNRGQPGDFDGWAEAGNRGWSFAEVLPYFRRSERRVGPGDDRYRGRDGPLPVTDSVWRHPICDAFIAGATGLGIPRNLDYNGAEQAGVGYYQRIIEGRFRVSTARAFLRPAMRRRNLAVVTGAWASRILFDGRRAVGVRYEAGGAMREVRARREVVLSAGTINTAKLLQLSGVGPAALLAAHGIPLVADVPGCGENFRDHFVTRIIARARGAGTINDRSRGLPLLGEILAWMADRPSILGLTPGFIHVFWKSDERLAEPDIQSSFTPASFRAGHLGALDTFPGMSCGTFQQRPESAGHVRIADADHRTPPLVQPNYLAAEGDRRIALAGLKLARRLLATPELAPFYERESIPGPEVRSDDELLDYARRFGGTAYHLIGTARMGPADDPMAVVDDTLRVRSVDGLRVADASVMPTVPSANTFAATLMIAEKAADMILGRLPPAPAEFAGTSVAARSPSALKEFRS